MILLAFVEVCKVYPEGRGNVVALDSVSAEIASGEFVGVWGPRRAGKSTLLRIAASHESSTSGSVVFDGHDLGRVSSRARAKLLRDGGTALVTSHRRVLDNILAVEHVSTPLLSKRMSLRDGKVPALQALERVGVSNCAYLPMERLSAAERFRVSLAQALVMRPRLLLVDEPTAQLGPSEGVELNGLLNELARDSALAVVVASQELAPLRRCERIWSIESGRVKSMTPSVATVLPFPRPDGVQAASS
jgi:ABC-type lipoprotein export system ATPase subunit